MTTSFDEGSLERFRDQAREIRNRANRLIFTLLCASLIAVCAFHVMLIQVRTPGSALLWPIAVGLLACAAIASWSLRTRGFGAGIVVLAIVMLVGISGVIYIDRVNAAGVIYGLTTVGVVFIAGFGKLGWILGLWLATWTASVSWAVSSGAIPDTVVSPFGSQQTRVVALVAAMGLIGLAALINQRRRRGLEMLLEAALKATEAERDEARLLAERRARTVAELGHEIRTPMTGIVGATQLLSQQDMSPVQRQLLSIQRQSAERLLNLVTAVLDEAKVESGSMRVRNGPYSLRLLTAEVTELFAPQANRKGVEIIWTAEPGVPYALIGDSMRVRQILSNLVSNAVKFTNQGEIHVQLLRPGHERLRIEVRDTGRGIAEQDLESVFDRFVSSVSDESQAYSTGLGLPICREFARTMGGQITASSRLGEGSCFSLEMGCVATPADTPELRLAEPPMPGVLWIVGASPSLEKQLRFLLAVMNTEARFVDQAPSDAQWSERTGQAQAVLIDIWIGHGRCGELAPAMLEDLRARYRRVIVINSVAQDAAFGVLDDVWQIFRPPRRAPLSEALNWAFKAQPEKTRPPKIGRGPIRILLVDDNAVNQIVGKAMLDSLGAEVVQVDGGQAAVDTAIEQSFDLILMDLQMPDMDGLEATRRLRLEEASRALVRTPVIAVTGQAGSDVDAECRAVGMDAVLLKPYTSAQLQEFVELHRRETAAAGVVQIPAAA